MSESIELQSLVGEHVLTGVDFSNVSIKEEWGCDFDDCQVMNFILDGMAYSAIEDPDDGYRSAMRELRVLEDSVVTNTFAPVKVVGRYQSQHGSEYSEFVDRDDILELIDASTGLVVLRVGTENFDDWYPCFIAEFTPENMSINQGVE